MAIEVELKTQIADKNWLLQKLGPKCIFKTCDNQLNHYFVQPNSETLIKLGNLLSLNSQSQFVNLIQKGKKFSVRTRCEYETEPAKGKVTLYIKYAIDDTTSENGVRRAEFANQVSVSIEKLDKILIDAGLTIQACWSRQRWTHTYERMIVAIDFNAGYGWLAEFEIEAQTHQEASLAELEIRKLLNKLQIDVINPVKLEKMFSYYNLHWKDYYLTQKIFDSSNM